MPEETENYIHIPVRPAADFVEDSFRTIDISEDQGIKAVIGRLKSDPDGPTHIQKYLFDKDQWTMDEAQEWVDEHEEDDKEASMTTRRKTLDAMIEGTARYKGYPFIVKTFARDEDGGLLVPGLFTDDQQDEVGDIILREATEAAVERWRVWGNIRTQHEFPSGTVVKIGEEDGLEWNQLVTRPVDPNTILLIEGGVLQAYSVGIIPREWDINEDALDEDDPWSWFWPPIIIQEYDMVEISYVDIPANPRAVFAEIEMAKEINVPAFMHRVYNQPQRVPVFKASPESPLCTGVGPSTIFIFEGGQARTKIVEAPEDPSPDPALEETATIEGDEPPGDGCNDARDLILAADMDAGEKDDEGKTVPRVDLELLKNDVVWDTFLGEGMEPTLENWLDFQARYNAERGGGEPSPDATAEEPTDTDTPADETPTLEEEAEMEQVLEAITGLGEKIDGLAGTINEGFELLLAKETDAHLEPSDDLPVQTCTDTPEKVEGGPEPNDTAVVGAGLTEEAIAGMLQEVTANLEASIGEAINKVEERLGTDVDMLIETVATLAKPQDRKAIMDSDDQEDEVPETRKARRAKMAEILDR